jgi:hypothetical protein
VQITNISDERRFAVFQALEEVELLVLGNKKYLNDYYAVFLLFKKKLLLWAKERLDEGCVDKFDRLIEQSYRFYTLKNMITVSERMPNVAADAGMLKMGGKL